MSRRDNFIWGAASIFSGPAIGLYFLGLAGPYLRPPDWMLWLFLISGLILSAEGFMGMMLAVRNNVIEPRLVARFGGLIFLSAGVFGWVCQTLFTYSATLLSWPLTFVCIGVLFFGLSFLPEETPDGHSDL